MFEITVDCDSQREKSDLIRHIGTLKGKQRITIVKAIGKRSTQANRYYFGVVVRAFCDYMRDQGEALSGEEAHEYLKGRFLLRDIVLDKSTGEILQVPTSSSKLDVKEFAEYIERCTVWLTEFFGIQLPTLEQYG